MPSGIRFAVAQVGGAATMRIENSSQPGGECKSLVCYVEWGLGHGTQVRIAQQLGVS